MVSMLLFVDESGDPGFDPSSSRYFTVALVCFETPDDAENTAEKIKEMKDSKWFRKPEFHFHRCNDNQRDMFFEGIKRCRFFVKYVTIEKAAVTDDVLRKNPKEFSYYVISEAFRLVGTNTTLRIKMDRQGNKRILFAVRAYLNATLKNHSIRKLTFHDSRSDVLIQLADMVAGCINRSFLRLDCPKAQRWYDCLNDSRLIPTEEKIIRIQEY